MLSRNEQLTHNFFRNEFEEDGYDMRIHRRIPMLCQNVRNAIGRPLYITSGVRSPEKNDLVGGSPNSSHLTGLAVDISTNTVGAPMEPAIRFTIIQTLLELRVRRIGIANNFIHFDIDENKAQDVIWVY
jgi:uncharacterized protein YcbK (DUF882 family)